MSVRVAVLRMNLAFLKAAERKSHRSWLRELVIIHDKQPFIN